MSQKITLRVVPKDQIGNYEVISRETKGEETVVMLRGADNFPDLHCGNCGALLAVGTSLADIVGTALLCNRCGCCNTCPNPAA